jgi:diacylglycerol kinase (ATP)
MPSQLALIAHASQVEILIHWMQKHTAALSAFQILTTPALAQQLQRHPLTASLATQVIEGNASVSDIQLAAQIIAGDVAGVIFLADPERENSEALNLEVFCGLAMPGRFLWR